MPPSLRRFRPCRLLLLAVTLVLSTPWLSRGDLAVTADDPYLWLEEVDSPQALAWVAAENTRTERELTTDPGFAKLAEGLLAIMDSKARIPKVEKLGSSYYNFWRDERQERGVWRRTTLDEYRRPEPRWETVLDLDALAKAEGVNWVWKGAAALPPDGRRALLHLSRGGADAVEVREFDLERGVLVPDGFRLPEAKTEVAWKSRDEIFVSTNFGPGSLTNSGYPRIVKLWRRGTPMSAAELVYEADATDVGVSVLHEFTPGFERDLVIRRPSFFVNETFVRRQGKLVKINKPDDADAFSHGPWLFLRLRSDWSVEGTTWPAGALLVGPFEAFLAGERQLEVLFTPSARRFLDAVTLTRDVVLFTELDNVRHRLMVARHHQGHWQVSPAASLPELSAFVVEAVDPLGSNDYWLTVSNFLEPASLHLGRPDGGAPELLKRMPALFDATKLRVEQHEAVSKDGTRVPYFEVARANLPLDGKAPTLLTGYGGFEVAELPFYNAIEGHAWLERGGVLVVANIRGGGEFGPRWHQAALKVNRPRAYEDFIAVGEDLVRRKVTSPRHLAAMGGSNGGLLVGNALVLRPDLFRAVVSAAPLLDMKRYHLLLAGASWIDEYGDPDKAEEWAFLRTFSPYHLVRPGITYPRTLFLTSTRDDRVHPGHARKMMARMLAQGHDVWFFENIEGGHAGASTNRQAARMWALAYTFLWRELGSASVQH